MICFGTALAVWSVGLAEGTYADMISLGTRTYSGHFQVVAKGYNKKPSLFKTVDDPEAVEQSLISIPQVTAVSERVETAGLLAFGNKTVGAQLTGVDPEKEKKVTTLHSQIIEGHWLDAKPGEDFLPIVLGSGVAKKLKTDLGDEISFVGQAADGSIAADLYKIVGIFETGAPELDAACAFIGLADARELLALGNKAHRVVGVVRRLEDLPDVEAEAKLADGLQFMKWSDVSPTLDHTIKSDRAGLWIFLAIIMAVVILGVVNTITMSVMERTRELGVLMALGTEPRGVVGLILCESAWTSLIGAAAGTGLGIAMNAITRIWGIPIIGGPITYGGVVIETMRAAETMTGDVIFPLIIFVSGLIAGLPPAVRAARLKPAAALRRF